MKLTDKVNVEFDLNWRGNFNLGISVFADKFDAYSGNSYMVGFSPNDCYLMRMANNVQNNLGRASFQDLRGKTKARISVRINKEEGTIALVLNNRVVKNGRTTPVCRQGRECEFCAAAKYVCEGQQYPREPVGR